MVSRLDSYAVQAPYSPQSYNRTLEATSPTLTHLLSDHAYATVRPSRKHGTTQLIRYWNWYGEGEKLRRVYRSSHLRTK